MGTAILKLLFMLMLVAGINLHFKEQQNKRNYRNLYPELVKYDSMTIAKLDSVLTKIER